MPHTVAMSSKNAKRSLIITRYEPISAGFVLQRPEKYHRHRQNPPYICGIIVLTPAPLTTGRERNSRHRPLIGPPHERASPARGDRPRGNARVRRTRRPPDPRRRRWSSARAGYGPRPSRPRRRPGPRTRSAGSRSGRTRIPAAGETGASPGNVGTQPSHRVHLKVVSKGKIERFFKTLRAQLLTRLAPEDTGSLTALNLGLRDRFAG